MMIFLPASFAYGHFFRTSFPLNTLGINGGV